MEQILKSLVSSPDNKRTMTQDEKFESDTQSASYAINALSHPSDDTYRKNLARYLDKYGFDLISKDNKLYMGDRDSLNVKPVTKSFIGDMVATAPEIAGSIVGGVVGSSLGPLGATAGAGIGSVAGDGIQQMINSYMLGEELTTDERLKESGKSALLGAGGELGGQLIGRAITPLRELDIPAMNANKELFNRYNVKATPATTTGHTGMQWFEEIMAKGSLGGKSIAKAKETEIEGIESAVNKLLRDPDGVPKGTSMGGTGDIYDSGASLAYNVDKQRGLAEQFFTDRYSDLVKTAGVTEIPMTSLKGTAKQIVDNAERIPAFKNGIDTFAKRVIEGPDNLTYEEYQQLRSYIGSKIKDASVTGQSGSSKAYKQLYGAINNDFDDVFKGSFADTKKGLDEAFKKMYKEPFEDGFTKGILGTSRNKIDPERIGGLIANSSTKARTAMNTADAGFTEMVTPNGIGGVGNVMTNRPPSTSMKSASDFILDKSIAPDGGMSLPKIRTNLNKAKGIDQLLGNTDELIGGNLRGTKDDVIKMIELSGANNKVANKSGTAWMTELLQMKNDPMRAIAGFVSDTGLATTYNRDFFQKWLTNGLIKSKGDQRAINALMQTGIRQGD